jgi:serine/threonine protein kinase
MADSEYDDFLKKVASAPPVVAPQGDVLDGPPTVDAARPFALPSGQLPTIAPECYEILGEHARGGMGRILLAIDRRLGRRVAIKELLSTKEDLRARFLRETLLTASLQHPGVVPVYEAGQWPTGTPFYAMKLISGVTLRDLLDETPRERRLALLPRLIAAVDAVTFAHVRRVVHRDLKPSNILCGPYGDTYVIDWGLAKILDPSLEQSLRPDQPPSPSGMTDAGQVMGTPGYMSPEQASGAAVDTRADVYALGCILCEILGGEPARAGEPMASVVKRLTGRPPALLAVASRAVAADRDARHPSARELAADLAAFMATRLAPASSMLGSVRNWFR